MPTRSTERCKQVAQLLPVTLFALTFAGCTDLDELRDLAGGEAESSVMLRDATVDATVDATAAADAGARGRDGAVGDAGREGDSDGSKGCTEQPFYRDEDGDGHGDPLVSVLACEAPQGYVAAGGDCNDACPTCVPDGTETCNDADDDCDGMVDEGFANKGEACDTGVGACARSGEYACNDAGDGTQCSVSAGAAVTEICGNGADDDCDDTTDESPRTAAHCSACGAACAGGLACNAGQCAQPTAALRLGGASSCALLGAADTMGAHAVSCWGRNTENMLRFGAAVTYRERPTALMTGNFRDVALGDGFGCTLDDNSDNIWCVGTNGTQELGTSSAVSTNTFSRAGTVAISAGHQQACALTSSGQVHCWGMNFNVRGSNVAYPTRQMVLAGPAAEVAAGHPLACARLTSGQVQCWGGIYAGDPWTANTVVDGGGSAITNAVQVVAKGATGAPASHACARRSNGAVVCWGMNYYGQLGRGTSETFDFAPAAAVSGLSNVVDISVGIGHSCALTSAGQVYCWGSAKEATGSSGAAISTPVAIAGLNDVIDIDSGWSHNCARRRSGQVVCWGDNSGGQLGDDSTIERTGVRNVYGLP